MKKFLALLIVLLLCSTALITFVACGDFAADGIVITFKHTMGQTLKGVTNDAIARFNKVFPKIRVVIDDKDSDYDVCFENVRTELNAGSAKAPALTYCYPDHVASYMKKNNVVMLDSYIDSTETIPANSVFGNTEPQPVGYSAEQKADFVEAFYNEGKLSYGDGSKTYSMAFAKSSEVLFYNADVFTANNLVPPTHWWCGDDCTADCKTSVEYVCKALKDLYPNDYPLGYDSESNLFITLCEQFGAPYTSNTGDHYLFNNDVIKPIIARLNDWYNKGWFRTSTKLGASVFTSSLFTASTGTKMYMSIGSTGGSTYNYPKGDSFKVGVAPVPQADTENQKVIMQGPSICILQHGGNKTADQKMASWLLLKFLTTDVQLQAEFSMNSGYTPVLKSIQDNDTYIDDFLSITDKSTGLAATAVKQTIKYMENNAFYTSPAFHGSSEARTQVETALVGCLGVTGTADEIAAVITSKLAQAVTLCEEEYPSK